MITLLEQLEKAKAKIGNNELLVSLNSDKHIPISSIDNVYSRCSRFIIRLSYKIDNMIDIKEISKGNLKLNYIPTIFFQSFINSAKAFKDELIYDLKTGDYVEFKHFDETVKGYIEDTYYMSYETVTNIEKTQFSFENSWSNYILKGASLKYIRENIITHNKSILCDEVTITKDEIDKFFNIYNEYIKR